MTQDQLSDLLVTIAKTHGVVISLHVSRSIYLAAEAIENPTTASNYEVDFINWLRDLHTI